MNPTSHTQSLGTPISGSALRRARHMRHMSLICASAVGNFMAYGGVFLLALLLTGWLNPHRVDAILLFASLACIALLGACLFSIAYWFYDLRS